MILDRYLQKLGVSSYLELNDEERRTYREWEAALSGRSLTDADVATFLQSEVDDAIGKVVSTSLTEKEDTFLKMKIEFIRNVQAFLDRPKREQETLEKQLGSQL